MTKAYFPYTIIIIDISLYKICDMGNRKYWEETSKKQHLHIKKIKKKKLEINLNAL